MKEKDLSIIFYFKLSTSSQIHENFSFSNYVTLLGNRWYPFGKQTLALKKWVCLFSQHQT